jgi:hypothetical protein
MNVNRTEEQAGTKVVFFNRRESRHRPGDVFAVCPKREYNSNRYIAE